MSDVLAALLGLVALINPLAALPSYLTLTAHATPRQQADVALRCAAGTSGVVLSSAQIGAPVLAALGLTTASAELAGGLILLLYTARMLWGRDVAQNAGTTPVRGSFYPLTVPLLVGPATVATVAALASSHSQWGLVAWSGLAAVIGAVVFVVLVSAHRLAARLTPADLGRLRRIAGLVLMGVAINSIQRGFAISTQNSLLN